MDRKVWPIVIAGIVILAGIIASRMAPPGREPRNGPEKAPPPAETSRHLLMGNPSGATDDPKEADNFLMRKEYFALS